MQGKEQTYFKLLKGEIVSTLQKTCPGMNGNIESWKGQDIVNFQDDLLKKVNSTFSEKWFYTHIKSNSGKVPRIDMLNLLSQYAGYTDWNDFVIKHPSVRENNPDGRKPVKRTYLLIYFIGFIALLLFGYTLLNHSNKYSFCFVDADLQQPVKGTKIEVILLNEGESPVFLIADSNGCIELKTREDRISFIIKAPYYKIDTITRVLSKRVRNENVKLHANDYAMMIHYFSTSDVTNWKKRRKQLDEMFADNARIYHVFGKQEMGVEMYNKQEFINKLTTPLSSLKNIEVIETIYTGNKISVLRFKMK